MKEFVVIALILAMTFVPSAAAHPFTEQTIPDSTVNAPVGISEVIVYFSEPIELNFSTITVFDSNGDQIDYKDTMYYEDEKSLIVTTPPLDDGVYTVTTKVLSKIDGHLVPGTFLFGVGNVIVIEPTDECYNCGELILLPEAGSRFLGMVGQTIVLGAVIASLLIWGTQNKRIVRDGIDKIQARYHDKFMFFTGIGLALIFVSNIFMITIQTVRLETTVLNAVQTDFGTIWVIRMSMTVILLGIWFVLDRKGILTKRDHILLLAAILVLTVTSSLIGHGAASGHGLAVILDYVHNLVAAVWIGGILYFVFILLPTLSQLKEIDREKMSLVLIPRFSIAFTIAVGVVIITGPTLLWFLESDVGLITESVYGQLIILKVTIAAVMIGLGGLVQFRIQKNAENALKSGKIFVYKKLKRTLKIDTVLGVILLGVVALLINGTLPAGEIQKIDAQEIVYGFRSIEFSENIKYDIEIMPFSSGDNTVRVKASNSDGTVIDDLREIKVKVSNPLKNISPIQISMEALDDGEEEEEEEGMRQATEFQGELVFGFSDQWQVEIEAQRTEHANESIIMDLNVKPRLADIRTEIIEYELPEDTSPLFPVYHEKTDSIWISDAAAPRVWQFILDTEEFVPYTFEGTLTTSLTIDSNDDIWFVDIASNQIGHIDTDTKQIKTKTIPELEPTVTNNIPLSIQADFEGNIWTSIFNKNTIMKYLPEQDIFEKYTLPVKESLPFALAIDENGDIWYTATKTGEIGFINSKNGNITQFYSDRFSNDRFALEGPEYMLFDENGDIWIAEHAGTAIAKFSRDFESFERIVVPNSDALPFGMTFDRYGNIWFAQHVVDSIGAYDPDNDDLIEVQVPSETSFVQFMTSDSNDNVWFVEQEAKKIGTVVITEIPVDASQIAARAADMEESSQLKYTEIVSPLIALGIISTSLFYVKNVQDKRRLNELLIDS